MNIGNEYAVFETGTRNTGTSLAGKDAANPTAFIRALLTCPTSDVVKSVLEFIAEEMEEHKWRAR
ncbi:hypothetical protein OSTOST_25786 [Ostertagia ostertagi]